MGRMHTTGGKKTSATPKHGHEPTRIRLQGKIGRGIPEAASGLNKKISPTDKLGYTQIGLRYHRAENSRLFACIRGSNLVRFILHVNLRKSCVNLGFILLGLAQRLLQKSLGHSCARQVGIQRETARRECPIERAQPGDTWV